MSAPKYNGEVAMSLSILSILNGAYDNQVLTDRDQAINAGLSAVISFAIETGGYGQEVQSLREVDQLINTLKEAYGDAINNGTCTGKSRGGFDRRTTRH